MTAQEESIAQAMRRIRKRLGLTQENVAEAAKYSRSRIASIESGMPPSSQVLRRIVDAFGESGAAELKGNPKVAAILDSAETQETGGPIKEDPDDDMLTALIFKRRSTHVDLSGRWNAVWQTTVEGEENRNREEIEVQRRLGGSWQFRNKSVSEDNPKGGYLWVARMDLFDNRQLLGYYLPCEPSVIAKGTLFLELQPNGREIIGVWSGLNFDRMWASGRVAMCRDVANARDPSVVLGQFIKHCGSNL
jgi:transcriptional regulator with XRE-family HTH domain